MWEWILREWDNGGRNIKPDQAEFIDIGLLSEDSMFLQESFNMEVHTFKKVFKGLNG